MRRSAGVVMLLILGTIALPAHILAQQTESWNGQVRDLECRLLSGVDQAAPEPQDLRAGDEARAPVRVTWRAPAQAAKALFMTVWRPSTRRAEKSCGIRQG